MPYLSTRYLSREEAALAAQFLKDEGIEAWVSAADAGGTLPSMQSVVGVRIEVSDEDLERASSLTQDGLPDEAVPRQSLSRRDRVQSWAVAILLVLVIGWVIFNYAQSLSGGATDGPEPIPPQHDLPF